MVKSHRCTTGCKQKYQDELKTDEKQAGHVITGFNFVINFAVIMCK